MIRAASPAEGDGDAPLAEVGDAPRVDDGDAADAVDTGDAALTAVARSPPHAPTAAPNAIAATATRARRFTSPPPE